MKLTMIVDPKIVPTNGGFGDKIAVVKAQRDTIVNTRDNQEIKLTLLNSQNIARRQAAG